jgi:hypothetical protein
MNERIRELAVKSLKHPDTDNDGLTVFDNDELAKFAELIVRECASICELNGQSYKHSFTPAKAKLAESTSVYCGTLITKHFGVEE